MSTPTQGTPASGLLSGQYVDGEYGDKHLGELGTCTANHVLAEYAVSCWQPCPITVCLTH